MANGADRRTGVSDESRDAAVLANLQRDELDPYAARLEHGAQCDHPTESAVVDPDDPHGVADVAFERGHIWLDRRASVSAPRPEHAIRPRTRVHGQEGEEYSQAQEETRDDAHSDGHTVSRNEQRGGQEDHAEEH